MVPLVFGLIASALATSFYERPFPDAVRGAPTIVRGKIGRSNAQWTTLPDGSKHLFTYYDVEVSEGLKGPPSSSAIRIRELGGTKDGVSLNVSGTAGFDPGEDVVVMLGEPTTGDGTYPVVGMMMGKFNLEKGADGKDYLRGPGLGDEHSGKKTAQISLEGLRDIIRAQAAEPAPTSLPSVKVPVSNERTVAIPPGGSPSARTEIQGENQNPTTPKPESSSKPIVLGLGFLIGFVWFLKSRRKRR